MATPTIDHRSLRPDLPDLIAVAERAADGLSGGPDTVDIERWVGGLATLLWNQVVTGGDPAGIPILRWLSKVPHKPRPIDLIPMPDWLAEAIPGAKPPVELEGARLFFPEERADEFNRLLRDHWSAA